jgi:cytidylate kinase
MLLTISREYGAGGSSVARLVAERLRWRLVDNQLVEEVARRAGLDPDDVARREERGPSFIERLARALVVATPELIGPAVVDPPEADEARLLKLTEQVVNDASAEENAVLVGRAAVALIGRRQDAFHVRLIAPLDYRIRVISDRLSLGDVEAGKRIREVDDNRARYHRQYYDRDWRDALNYHLTLNTGWLGLERSADLIVEAVSPET